MSKLSDKCSNCGSTKSSDFWDYPDGTVLCDKCEKTISAKWEKEHDQPAKSKNEKNIDKCCNCGSTKSKKFWIHNDLPLYVTGSVFCDDCEKLIVPLLKDGVGLNEPKQEKKVTGKELKQPMKNPNLMFFAEFVKPIPYTQDFRKFTLDVCTVICKNCKYVVGIRGKEGEYAEGFAIFCFGIQTYADFSKLLETFIGYLIKEFKKDNLKIDKPMDIPYTYEELMTILSAQGIEGIDDLVVSKVMLETQLKMKDKMPVICLTAGMATIYDLANKRYDYNEMKKKLQQAKKPIIKKN